MKLLYESRREATCKGQVKAGPLREKKTFFEARKNFRQKNVATKLEGGGTKKITLFRLPLHCTGALIFPLTAGLQQPNRETIDRFLSETKNFFCGFSN